MAKAFYSAVLDHSAEAVWAVIRPFDHYAWAGVEVEVTIEDGKAGDQVGAVRCFTNAGKAVRQKLLAHSDLERSYSYGFCDPTPFPVRDYIATIRVVPVVSAGKAFIEWSASFDCALEERERWIDHFERQGFEVWLAALARFMEARNPAATPASRYR